MLKEHGKFILVVANEKYLENKLKEEKDLFIKKIQLNLMEKNTMSISTIQKYLKSELL